MNTKQKQSHALRTATDIMTRMKEVEQEDFFGTIGGDLLTYLSFEQAAPFLKPEYVQMVKDGKEKWPTKKVTRKNVLKEMKDYMSFAIGKARDHRGLSAGRSIDHYKAWTWLLNDNSFETIDWDNYAQYGVPILKQICTLFNFPFPTNEPQLENMANGEPCHAECGGCGH